MERERLTVALNAVRPSRWKIVGVAAGGRRRMALSSISVWPYIWLALLYLCALYAFHSMAH
jgi:hypothetical protein